MAIGIHANNLKQCKGGTGCPESGFGMHIHYFAPHANRDLHTVMNSFDLWIPYLDLPHRCQY